MGSMCVSSCRCCVFVSVVHPVAILRAVFCVICSLFMFLSDASGDHMGERWSCHSGFKLLCKLCRTSPPPAMGARFTVFWACGPAGWLALLLTKAGDVETNPGPTTLNKKVWICDICHKQIHVHQKDTACSHTHLVHPRPNTTCPSRLSPYFPTTQTSIRPHTCTLSHTQQTKDLQNKTQRDKNSSTQRKRNKEHCGRT